MLGKEGAPSAGGAAPASVNQSALTLIMDQIKDLIEINTSLNKKYRDLEAKLSGLNTDVGSDKKSVTEMQSKLSEVQSNMEKFIGLYEVITNQFNPFVDTGDETDNYEIDAEGNPVPLRKPKYGIRPPTGGEYYGAQPSFDIAGPQGGGASGGGGVVFSGGRAQSVPSAMSVDAGEQKQPEHDDEQSPEQDAEKKTEDALSAVPEQKESMPGEDMPVHRFYDTTQERRRLSFGGMEDLDKISLDTIIPLTTLKGNVHSITTILSWMVYLSRQAGQSALEVLKYYTTIGWISPQVALVLSNYLHGLNVKADEHSDGHMDVSDHVVSLFFIAKIKGVNLNAKTYRLISQIVKSKGFIMKEQ